MQIIRTIAAVLAAAVLASCGGADAAQDRAAAEAAPVEEVRALVEQFGLGGGDKDVAGEHFHELGPRAAPGLRQLIEDPATPIEDLHSILLIVQVYVADPELFAALRTRGESLPDPGEREMFVGLVDAMEASGASLPYPR